MRSADFYNIRNFSAVIAVSFILGLLLQACSELPWSYSWGRALALFWIAIRDNGFVVTAFFCIFAAWSCSRKELLQSLWNLRSDPYLYWSIVVSLLSMIAPIAFRNYLHYSLWDYLFFPLAVFLLLNSAHARKPVAILFRGLGGLIVFVLVSYVFTVFKSQLFVVRPAMDELFVAWETLFFGQPLYSLLARWSAKHLWVVALSERVYFMLFHHIAWVALFLFAVNNAAEQFKYVLSLSLCYLLGGLSYYVFPAVGPVFFDPSTFHYLDDGARFTVSVQEMLRQSTNAAMEGRLDVVETYAFIACMPSLHIAHETVMLFYSRRSPLMLLLSIFFWLTSCFAVLVLGWHYLFDVLGGIILGAIVLACVQPMRLSQELR